MKQLSTDPVLKIGDATREAWEQLMVPREVLNSLSK